ncbi:HpcH/HpaI aldolase family protein [Halalkalicoccus salilacus]|uniref:HpcH/HpaI aldolase family protein n=1 Tax=Halalkalicoccus salilacus TaxID=3117459 RepID=UPI00300F5D03
MVDNNNHSLANLEISRRRYMQGTAGVGIGGLLGTQGAMTDQQMNNTDASFSEKLESGEPLYGISDPLQGIDSAAIVSQHPETDWVWVDGEHGAIWIEEIRRKLATFPDDTAGLVRIPGGDPKEVEQVLDAGARGVIIPKKRDPEEVERFVESAYFPPEGNRGEGGPIPEVVGNDEVFVVVQVETPEIIEQIEDVAAIDGIDSLLVGPNDLSNFMGVSPESSQFQQAVDRVLRVSQENDIIPGYWVGSEDESEFVEEGWQLLSLGSASGLLSDAISNRIP